MQNRKGVYIIWLMKGFLFLLVGVMLQALYDSSVTGDWRSWVFIVGVSIGHAITKYGYELDRKDAARKARR